ncbi:RnfH family protein [Amphritea balenae]|uniref:UPF0125 protein EHS89_15740 n=1 Tax=Amphritea balenae TaxID=452629 RepID=A0A3P1SMZ3_9GAMM|nr:RnfH family protein [Amphritea balenae]RRC98025.1 RnfH family protein [Amphritea balenae]GGK66912.1 UPF0125 protein [Amphritea balenae]
MNVSLVYADPNKPLWLELDVSENSTLGEAIENSGILQRLPDIDLDTLKTGIFGKLAKLTQELQPGDRIEIYNPVFVDPKTVKRRDRD